jgi:hypothetical protein
MKLWKEILLIAFFVIILIFIGLHIFVNIQGKSLLAKKLEATLNREVKIGSLVTSFPATINIKNIEAKDLFKIDEVVAAGGFFDIFRRSFKLSKLKISRPTVTLQKGLVESPAEVFTPNENAQAKTENKAATPDLNPVAIPQGEFLFPRFFISHFIVNEGTINFIDRSISKDGLVIKIEHLNIKVDNLNFGRGGSYLTDFELKGRIPWQEGKEEGKIEAVGWLNFPKRDMQATLKIEDIDGVYLYPYYSKWVDLEKARIEKANLNFTSNIQGLNNNVTADCHLELTDIVRKPRSPDEPEEKAERITNAVLDIFRALNQGKIVLDFTIRTKMDRPEFGFGNIKMAFENRLAEARTTEFKPENVLMLPVKLLEGLVKGATDFSKAVVDGTFAVGKEVKKSVEDAFKKEK